MGGTERCSLHPFCDEDAVLVVPAPDGSDYPVCRGCYESDCGRCRAPIEKDENVAKGLCQGCRDEIRMWGGDDERGVEKDPGNEQTKLVTDGGTVEDGAGRTDIFGEPLPELTEKWQYVPCIRGNYSGRTGYDSRHEAIGQCAILNRRNPDVEFSVVSVEVRTGAE